MPLALAQLVSSRIARRRLYGLLLGLVCLGIAGRHSLSRGLNALVQTASAAPQAPAATPVTQAPPDDAATHPFTQRRPLTLPVFGQTKEQADAASVGCVSCHQGIAHPSMHAEDTVVIGCANCHGGDASVMIAGTPNSPEYQVAEDKAHVHPRIASNEARGGHPVRAYTDWLKESSEFIRFANPGDLRVARQTCGVCHVQEVRNVRSSMMTHGAMLWGAALYNNGAYPLKNPHFGESYGENGEPERMRTFPVPTPEETKKKGVLPYLDPLQRWQVSEPGNMLRVFERGGEKREEIGNPETDAEPGKPDLKLSDRGLGTELRTDPVFLGLQKTRLLDPLLSMPGTNDNPGDYRSSGCSGCHVLYANDRDPRHGEQTSAFGNNGRSNTGDITVNKTQSGHPLDHVFTKSIPSSQCMTCHVHPGTNMVTTYYGFTWWDNEADGSTMYSGKEMDPSAQRLHDAQLKNPEGSAARGKWINPAFLEQVGTPQFNADLKDTKFGDFHSHGWVFRAVFKRDREGHLLDKDGAKLPTDDLTDEQTARNTVHLMDIHLQKGMACADCHFLQDAHGNGKLYGETRNAIEIGCQDCHGTINNKALLKTSGPASANDASSNMLRMRTPFKQARFYWEDGKLWQRSNIEQGRKWEVVQVLDSITPGNEHYSEKSRLAKTIQIDGKTWGMPADETHLAHPDAKMTCYSCHSSWTTSCFGCHLSMSANQKMPQLHNEGGTTRNYTNYNFMVLRDDVYMLGVDGTVTGNKIAPVRSACAVVVSSQNANRNWLYQQQQTISAPGFSGEAFSTYVPHTVRSTETKGCTDCHVSKNGDNNAWMAQLMVQGTNFLNFMGKYIYVANGKEGLEAIPVAEGTEPPAIQGSDFHQLTYPANYKKFLDGGRQLKTGYGEEGDVLDVQLRGEYLYAAMGKEGFRVFDVADIDVKDSSERLMTAPVSPLGQRFYVKSKFATALASPSTLALDPLRKQIPENEEGKIAPIYAFLYGLDKYEGLVVIGDPKTGVGTLLDGNPRNNFLRRALTWNPGGKLDGAHRITIAGTYAYILCNRGLVVVNLANPLKPEITAEIGPDQLQDPTGIAIQFRYAFVTDHQGLKVFDVTHLEQPRRVGTTLPLDDARNVYVARTYAYVSSGRHGIEIVNVERPEQPKLAMNFTAGGALNDTNDLKIGMVSSSQFAFVADGKNGMRIVQLFSSKSQRTFYGFSPMPVPELIATRRTKGESLVISKGVDRDRAVDESGNQLAVFGRRGARPLNDEEMRRMYLRAGELYTVTDLPPNAPQNPPPPAQKIASR